VELCQELMEGLKNKGIRDILVIVGGIIPRDDISILKNCGVDGVFPVHSTPEEVEKFIREHVSHSRGVASGN
jgi:methylmalonyl-CoA mutase C-terminal domain/subunit